MTLMRNINYEIIKFQLIRVIELPIYHPLTGIMTDFVLEMRQIDSLTKEEGDSDKKSILIGRYSLKSRQTQIVCLSPQTLVRSTSLVRIQQQGTLTLDCRE